MPETWRKVDEFLDRYEVSDLGRVRSWCVMGSNHDRRRKTPRVLKAWKQSKFGHLSVTLHGGVKSEHWLVHNLVLHVFVGPCPQGLVGSHVNGKAFDNLLSNLIYETQSQNLLRMKAHGTVPKWSKERKKAWLADPERRLRHAESIRLGWAKRTPLERREIALKRAASMTTEQRKARASKTNAAMTPMARSERTSRGWETRRGSS